MESGFPAHRERARLFAHLRSLPGPLRLADLAGYVSALGIAPARTFSRTLQGTPIRAEGGTIGTVVVTIQDLAPLDELERMQRAGATLTTSCGTATRARKEHVNSSMGHTQFTKNRLQFDAVFVRRRRANGCR